MMSLVEALTGLWLALGDPSAMANCQVLTRSISANEVILAEDARGGSCTQIAGSSEVFYDRKSGVVRAKTDLPAGTQLGRIFLSGGRFVESGAVLNIRFNFGPVAVNRQVRAVQAGLNDTHIFVAGEDGQAFRIPVHAIVKDEDAP